MNIDFYFILNALKYFLIFFKKMHLPKSNKFALGLTLQDVNTKLYLVDKLMLFTSRVKSYTVIERANRKLKHNGSVSVEDRSGVKFHMCVFSRLSFFQLCV